MMLTNNKEGLVRELMKLGRIQQTNASNTERRQHNRVNTDIGDKLSATMQLK